MTNQIERQQYFLARPLTTRLRIPLLEKLCSGGAADFESFIKGINSYLGSSDPDGPETPNA